MELEQKMIFCTLDMGYARRLLFSYVPKPVKVDVLDAKDVYASLTDTTTKLMISH